MDADGSGKTRLTDFTNPARPEFQSPLDYAIPGSWRDDRRFYFTVNKMSPSGQLFDQSQIFLLTFTQ